MVYTPSTLTVGDERALDEAELHDPCPRLRHAKLGAASHAYEPSAVDFDKDEASTDTWEDELVRPIS